MRACHQSITENDTDETKKLNPQIATGVQTYAWPWCQSNTQIKRRSVQTAQIELNPQMATVVERYAWPGPLSTPYKCVSGWVMFLDSTFSFGKCLLSVSGREGYIYIYTLYSEFLLLLHDV